jgi:WD40 repeat protein
MAITSRSSKQQKLAQDCSNDDIFYKLPNCVIRDHILPFVDRSTWDNLAVANREIYEGSRNLEAPWPVGKLGGAGNGHAIAQLCFSSDGKCLCVFSEDQDLQEQRIRMWHKVVGSCGCIAFDLSHGFFPDNRPSTSLWRVCFSPVENLLASLHDIDDDQSMFRLWEVKAEGLSRKVELQLYDNGYALGCTFSRDGRQLILYSRESTLRIYSVSDAQLIKVIHLVGDRQEWFSFVGLAADARQVVCVEDGIFQTNRRVRLWDIHGDGSTFEDIYVCQEGDSVSKVAISPLDNLIAVMTRNGVIKLARRVRDMAWTVEVVADGKCFDIGNLSFSTSGQLLATVRADGGVEIWDATKGKCLRTIVCDRLWKLAFSPDGNLLAAATSSDGRLCVYNI